MKSSIWTSDLNARLVAWHFADTLLNRLEPLFTMHIKIIIIIEKRNHLIKPKNRFERNIMQIRLTHTRACNIHFGSLCWANSIVSAKSSRIDRDGLFVSALWEQNGVSVYANWYKGLVFNSINVDSNYSALFNSICLESWVSLFIGSICWNKFNWTLAENSNCK